MTGPELSRPPRSVYIIAHGTWLAGLALPFLLGALVRLWMASRGVDVVTVGRGLALLLPFALWLSPPYLVLARFNWSRLRRGALTSDAALARSRFAAIGAVIGMLIATALFIFEPLAYAGPGGLSDSLSTMMVLSFLTFPLYLLVAGTGAVIGWWLGRLCVALASQR